MQQFRAALEKGSRKIDTLREGAASTAYALAPPNR